MELKIIAGCKVELVTPFLETYKTLPYCSSKYVQSLGKDKCNSA